MPSGEGEAYASPFAGMLFTFGSPFFGLYIGYQILYGLHLEQAP